MTSPSTSNSSSGDPSNSDATVTHISSSIQARRQSATGSSLIGADGPRISQTDLQEDRTASASEDQPIGMDNEKTVIRDRSPESGASPSGSRPMFRIGWHVSAESLIGQQLDHFRIDSLVGIGGMGAVFRGEDIRLNREVAIKAIPAAGRDPESMRRFRFEAQSAAKLDHPNIARVYHVGETADWSYIVFEFVEGTNLREIVIRNGPMSVEQSVYLVRQVSQALQHASERQVVHRDIKPSNIVLTPAGQAKIVDMGLARVTEMDRSTNDLTASGVTLGTFDYISPEQAHDPRDADVRSDIYSLGCSWYYLLTGRPPFPEGTALQKLLMHGTKMPEDPRVHRSELSDSLIAILRKMLAKKPGDRYQQPMDLIDDLQTLAVLEDLSWTRDSDPREMGANQAPQFLRRYLPFAVALSSIVAIAVWMHADGVKRSQFTFPEIVATASTRSSEAVGASGGGSEEPTGVLTVPTEAGSIVVDTRFTQEQLDSNRQLVASMDQAIERLNVLPDATRIVIQSPIVTSSNNLRALSRSRSKVTIESDRSSRTQLLIDVSESDISDSRAWMDCGTNHITLQGFDIVWRTHSVRQSLFVCRNGSQLQLVDCSIAIESSADLPLRSALPAVVRCESSLTSGATTSGATTGTNLGSATGSSATAAAVLVNIKNSVITGHGDALQVIPPIRTESRIENSLLAIQGSLLHVPRVNGAIQGNSRIVLDMEHVTSWTARSLIQASWTSANTSPIPITRTARECVFSGMESIVYWDVAANEDWDFWEQAKRGEDLSRWLDFRGLDNSYDADLTKRIVEAYLRNGMAETVPFTLDAALLSAERGLEFAIPWKHKPTKENATRPFSGIEQFELLESNFPRGARLSSLPTAGRQPESESSSSPPLSPTPTLPASGLSPSPTSTGPNTPAVPSIGATSRPTVAPTSSSQINIPPYGSPTP